MVDCRTAGSNYFDKIEEDAMRFELTSIVLAAEQLMNWTNRIEVIPRKPTGPYAGARYYTQVRPPNHGVTVQYVFYSETDDRCKRARRRLDCAHELGHIILHNKALRQGISLTEEQEVEADWFALCLLQMHGYVNLNGRWDFPG